MFQNPELLKAEAMAGITTPDQAAERLIEQAAQLKHGGVQIPNENSTPEEVAAFREAIGVPQEATAEAYGLKDPGFDPNSGVTYSPELAKWFAETAHEEGIPASAAQKMHDKWNDMQVQLAAARVEEGNRMTQDTTAALKQRLGEAYGERMTQMRQVVNELAGEDAQAINKMLEDPHAGSRPEILNFLLNVRDFYAQAKGEDAFKGRNGGQANLGMTPAEARAEVNAITKDRNSPYWDKHHPAHKDTVDKVNRLYEAMSPKVD